MTIPDTIYIHPADWMQHYVTEDGPERIAYHRERECVWRPYDTGDMTPDDHGAYIPASRVINWRYCPYCGGRIRIKEEA